MRKKILFQALTHGDEPVGRSLFNTNPQGFNEYCEWQTIIGNPKASELAVRYVVEDLNRSYPVKPTDTMTYEKTRMQELVPIIRRYDIMYDIHQTSFPFLMPDCVFINEISEAVKSAIEPLSAKYVIVDDGEWGGCYVTCASPCGITLEYGRTGNYVEESSRLLNDVHRIVNNIPADKEILENRIWMRALHAVPPTKGLDLQDFVPLTNAQKKLLNLDTKRNYMPVFVRQHPGQDNYYCFLNEVIA